MKCFMVEDLRRARYSLRRYAADGKCPSKRGYHDARSAVIAETEEKAGQPYTGTNPPEVVSDDDVRWPAACACGYVFSTADKRQIWADGLYRRTDTGEVLTWEAAPAGAIRDAHWWAEGGHGGADGHAWSIKLPDGSDFMTEQKANNCSCRGKIYDPAHRCWTRSGVPPLLTISPSIQTGGWHGWLRDGILVQA